MALVLFEEEMSDDEVFALLASLALGLVGATLWYLPVGTLISAALLLFLLL